jgi:N-acetylglucosaminyldiphosphoundecaprenol N-acetyl-beta-D-mannosaminyltransferase
MIKSEIIGAPCLVVKNEKEAKKYINELIEKRIGGYSVAINAEKIMMYNRSENIKNIIDNSILPIPDGSGSIIGLKLLHKISSIKLNLPKVIYEIANEQKYRLFIFGASEEVNSLASNNLKKKYENINIVGSRNGYNIDQNEIYSLIKDSNPQIVLIALGSPKQEVLAKELLITFPDILFIGCGGALDIISGKVKRAPLFFQKNHLEWFYRLLTNPLRIKRQKVLPIFFFKLIKTYLKKMV